jgi:hypothetical protein
MAPLLDRGDVAKGEVDLYAIRQSLRCSPVSFLYWLSPSRLHPSQLC